MKNHKIIVGTFWVNKEQDNMAKWIQANLNEGWHIISIQQSADDMNHLSTVVMEKWELSHE